MPVSLSDKTSFQHKCIFLAFLTWYFFDTAEKTRSLGVNRTINYPVGIKESQTLWCELNVFIQLTAMLLWQSNFMKGKNTQFRFRASPVMSECFFGTAIWIETVKRASWKSTELIKWKSFMSKVCQGERSDVQKLVCRWVTRWKISSNHARAWWNGASVTDFVGDSWPPLASPSHA